MMMMKQVSMLAAAAVLSLGTAASAATIINGSFEVDLGQVATDGQLFNALAGGSGNDTWSVFTSLPGWATVSGAGIEVQTANTLTSIDPQDGGHYVELDSNNNSSMQQTINFTSTGRYLLSFWYSPRDSDALSNGIDYAIGTLLTGNVTGPNLLPPINPVGLWTEITAQFIVTMAGSQTLSFAAVGTSNSLGGFVDNVSIAAIPVPAGGLLLIGALGGLAALRRRRKTA